MNTPAETSLREQRLGELLERYQSLSPGHGLSSLRQEAGDLFPELVELAKCLGVLEAGIGGGGESEAPASIGPYVIEEKVGHGATSTVYKAKDPQGGIVALKVMHETLGVNPEAVMRFRREISIVSRVMHPNIVRILDHGEADGRLYLALEFVEGPSLADLLENAGAESPEATLARLRERGVACVDGPTPAESLARTLAGLFAQAARALTKAHEAGLVHRDLKPGNLLLGRKGQVKIIDFGLAKIFDEEFTSTLAVLGTPGFMSPEQASGESGRVDARTDIYGLGASLYRALTGEYPIRADSLREVLAAIVSDRPVSLSKRYPGCPPGIARIVARCLEKEPQDRYPDAATLAEDLDRAAAGRSPRAASVSLPRRARRFLLTNLRGIAAAATSLLLVAAFLIWWGTRPAILDVSTTPGATLALNGRALGTGEYRGEVRRGSHLLTAEREGFRPERKSFDVGPRERATFVLNLMPRDPFDRRALAVLAEAYERPAPMPSDDPPRPRGGGEEPIGGLLGLHRPEAFAAELAAYPEKVRGEPAIRVMAVARLLQGRLHAEALAAARDLIREFPGRREPYRLALLALASLGLEGSALYRELHQGFTDARD